MKKGLILFKNEDGSLDFEFEGNPSKDERLRLMEGAIEYIKKKLEVSPSQSEENRLDSTHG